MKKGFVGLLILILCAFVQFAHGATAVSGRPCPGGGATCTSVTVDAWQTFEFADPADTAGWATALATTDNVSDGTWSFTDGSNVASISTSGEQATIKCPGGVTDSGTRGMAIDFTGGSVAYAQYAPASAHGNTSFGFWYLTGDVDNLWTYGIIWSNSVCNLVHGSDGSTGYLKLSCTGVSSAITVSNTTMYWVTINFVKNGTSQLSVYDTSGSQVGSTVTDTAANTDWTAAQWGVTSAISGAAGTAYFDDLLIDWTDATFPLGP